MDGFSSRGMRDFVAAFRGHLAAAGAPTDDETVWRLLSRFQILVFDFESPGSDYKHRAVERARLALVPAQAQRAADIWAVLIKIAGRSRDCRRRDRSPDAYLTNCPRHMDFNSNKDPICGLSSVV